jgi:hypothetical protein
MVEPGLSLFSATRPLERIAHHATNIAEDVVYIVAAASTAGRGLSVLASCSRSRKGKRAWYSSARGCSPGAAASFAYGINSIGQIVGSYTIRTSPTTAATHGFLLSNGTYTS